MTGIIFGGAFAVGLAPGGTRTPYVVLDVFADAPLDGNQLGVFTDARGTGAEVRGVGVPAAAPGRGPADPDLHSWR
jgi:hypothetical protein